MTEFIFFINQVVIAGAVLGCIYALGAIGITLIFGILRFAHFAHSELMTSGAFFAFLLAMLFTSWGISWSPSGATFTSRRSVSASGRRCPAAVSAGARRTT